MSRHTEAFNKVPVDTGSVVVVDPAYLFNTKDWGRIVDGTRTTDAMHKAIFSKLKEKLGVPFCQGGYVSTGGDGTFTLKSGKHGLPITLEALQEADERLRRREREAEKWPSIDSEAKVAVARSRAGMDSWPRQAPR